MSDTHAHTSTITKPASVRPSSTETLFVLGRKIDHLTADSVHNHTFETFRREVNGKLDAIYDILKESNQNVKKESLPAVGDTRSIRANAQPYPKKAPNRSGNGARNNNNNNNPKPIENPFTCTFCDVVGHETASCHIYTTYAVRREVIDNKNLCVRCFKHSRGTVCYTGVLKCSHCGFDHAKALCHYRY